MILGAFLTVAVTAPLQAQQNYRDSRYYNPRTGQLDYSKGRIRESSPRGGRYATFAGSGDDAAYFGFRVGPAFTTVSSDDECLHGGRMKTGLNAGVAFGGKIARCRPLYLESGIYYVEKGGKGTSRSRYNRFTYNLDYIEIPLVFKYRAPLDEHIKIEPYLGGYFAVGVGGKIKDYEHREAYSSFGESAYGDNGTFKRCDGGLKFGCGFSYDMFYMDIAYDLGLTNICNDTFDTSRNSALNLNFGVNF